MPTGHACFPLAPFLLGGEGKAVAAPSPARLLVVVMVGSGGDVLHFVGSCCGELGTTSTSMGLSEAPVFHSLLPQGQGNAWRTPLAIPQRRRVELRAARAANTESQAPHPPSAKMEDAHFPCAVGSPFSSHGFDARFFEDGGVLALPSGWLTAPFTISSSDKTGRKRREKSTTSTTVFPRLYLAVLLAHQRVIPWGKASVCGKKPG